ncbi:glycosyltransferase family 4 protein [Plantibacter sp. MCCC 1A11337]|uniref:glycosyltransferase family 4 protein n=1 Tax=Plantibacter sp. MCCC 1A11337 TaxID=2736644 RepID=UPI001583528D|nr:glycosyltransferase family 4 protein [Plantibacter sp. MCCC 1A11337]
MPLLAVDLLSFTGTKGGMETYTRELYRAVGPQAAEFDLVGLASTEAMHGDLSWFPGEIIATGISGEHRFAWAAGELWRIAGIAKRNRADIIHAPATLGPARTALPLAVTMHDLLYWSHPELMSTPFYTAPVKWMERQVARAASRIITISEVSKAEIVKYLGTDPELIDVIPLAASAPWTATREPDRDAPFILATGNRRPHKNYDGLIRALALVEERVRPRLIVTGSHGLDDPLRAVVAELGLERFVDLRSWLSPEELGELYRTTTALAVPSFAEGFSLPPLEAMLSGVPVLVSDIDVHREVCGDAALFVDPHDLASIAAGLRTLATDTAEVTRLTERGRARAATFSWASTAERTLDVFRATLDPTASRPR